MSAEILVTYASRGGSTQGVADAIATTLTEAGAPAVALPMSDVVTLRPYRAVVAGSAIQSAAWLPEALDFVRENQTALREKPFAAFLVCMTLAMNKGDHRDHVATWLQPVRDLVPTVSEGLFRGRLSLDSVPSFRDRLMFRFSVLSGVWSEGDHRDWDAIRDWAQSLVPLLAESSIEA